MKSTDVITETQAEKYLKEDLEKYEKNVEEYNAKYNWNQNEFDALVSFAFNIGSIDQLTANGTRIREVIAEKILLWLLGLSVMFACIAAFLYDEERKIALYVIDAVLTVVMLCFGKNFRNDCNNILECIF